MTPSRIASVLLPFVVVCGCAARPQGTCPPRRAANSVTALRRAIAPDTTILTVDTVADLLALREADGAARYVVRGYHRPGDDGGGVFRYDPKGEQTADGGTVLAPRHLPGRFTRKLDPWGEVYAEWFGARGDGDGPDPHNDAPAINACLRPFARVRLLAKTYGVRGTPTHFNPDATYHAIDLGPRYRIEGSGRGATRIRLLDGSNPKGTSPGSNYFNVLANRRFHESADYVVVRGLTVDCNFDGQNKHTTINAIGLRGGGALVERCNFRGYGTGCHPTGNSRECFVIHQGLVYKDAKGCRQAAIYRDLDFTAPGHNGSVPGHVAEITHITLGGAHNFDNYTWILPKGRDPDFDPANGGENENNWWPSFGGLVENCTVRDERYDPATQKSPLHAITYGDSIGVTIRNNTVCDFEGAAVFVMSWWNRGTTIVDNHFLRVASGVALHVKGTKGKPLQCPRHEGVRIERNTITLGAPVHHRWSPIGIQYYGQDLDKAVRLKNILVRQNRIAGRSYADAAGKTRYPVGITIQLLRPNHQNLVFEDNVIDVPDFGQSAWIPQEPHSQSIVYFPLARWDEDATAGNVRFINNRTPAGRRVRPILADWWFKNEPAWGTVPHPRHDGSHDDGE